MFDRLEQIYTSTEHALRLIFSDAANVNPEWLVLGVLLHFLANAVRQKGWYAILRASYPDADDLRLRDVEAAYFAGSGINAVVPARGGDALKLFLLHRRIENSRYSTLAATFVPETLFETLFGIGLVVWALTQGFVPVPVPTNELPTFDVSFVIKHPFISAISVTAVTVTVVLIIRWLQNRGRPMMERLRAGLAILKTPRDYMVHVVTWQALGRVIRLGSLAAFMKAFDLPVTLETTILVMAAQGGGRIIPIAPVSAGLRLAMLSYGFVEVTGQAVDIASITAFTVGVSVVLLVTGLAVSLVIIFKVLGTLNPRHAVHAARDAVASRREAEPAATG